MILLLFIIGVIVITAIARYNEDDRLFWKLFASFTIAFTATSIAVATLGDKQDKNDLIEQVYPTQAPDTTMGYYSPTAIVCDSATVSEAIPAPASKDYTPAVDETFCSCEVYGKTRDQPPKVTNPDVLPNPPTQAFAIDSS